MSAVSQCTCPARGPSRCRAYSIAVAETSSTVTSRKPRPRSTPASGDAPPPTSITLSAGVTPAASSIRSDISGAAWNQLRAVSPWA